MVLYLIRHGKTEFNAQGRYTGCMDVPLSPEGERETVDRGAYPSVKYVAVSPLSRVRRTAELLFPKGEQRVYPDLREICLGCLEGKRFEELKDDPQYRSWVEGGCLDARPGGESAGEFLLRASAAVRLAAGDAMARGMDSLVIVCHGGTIRAALTALGEEKRDSLFSWPAPNLCCYRGEAAEESWRQRPLLTHVRLLDAYPFQ